MVDGFPDEASVDDTGATVTEVGPFTTTKPGSSEVEVDSPGTDPVEETPALPVSTERPSTSPASAGPSLGGPIPPAAHATPTPASTTTVERARRRRAIPSSDGRKRRRLDPPPCDSAIRAATRLASAWGLRRSRRGSSGTVSFSSSRPAGPKIRPRSLRVNDSPWSRRAGRVDRPRITGPFHVRRRSVHVVVDRLLCVIRGGQVGPPCRYKGLGMLGGITTGSPTLRVALLMMRSTGAAHHMQSSIA